MKPVLEPILLNILKRFTWKSLVGYPYKNQKYTSDRNDISVNDILWIQDLKMICSTSRRIVTTWFEQEWRHKSWASLFGPFLPYYVRDLSWRIPAGDYFQSLLNFKIDNRGNKYFQYRHAYIVEKLTNVYINEHIEIIVCDDNYIFNVFSGFGMIDSYKFQPLNKNFDHILCKCQIHDDSGEFIVTMVTPHFADFRKLKNIKFQWGPKTY